MVKKRKIFDVLFILLVELRNVLFAVKNDSHASFECMPKLIHKHCKDIRLDEIC